MKVAAVTWEMEGNQKGTPLEYIKKAILNAAITAHDLVVFPALIGTLFKNQEQFMNEIYKLSFEYPQLIMCPGSYIEVENERFYHTSCLIKNGQLLLKQRQLYLAKWERESGLSRGDDLCFIEISGFTIAIILSTDVFYSQVARYAALHSANLILSPVGIKGKRNFPRQLSGLWQNVQQNLFFAIESGFNGSYKGIKFASESIIHAPLEITTGENGFLAREESANKSFISATLNLDEQKKADNRFNPLRQLNKNAYKQLF